jgi:hypothetical protein
MQYLKPIILVIQEAETGKIMIQGQSKQKKEKCFWYPISKEKAGHDGTPVIPSMVGSVK